MFSTVVDIQLGTIPLRFGLGAMLKNTAQSNSKDMCNATPAVPSYSNVTDKPSEEKYEDIDFVVHALCVFEGVKSSKGHLTKHLVLIQFRGMFQPCLVNFKSFMISDLTKGDFAEQCFNSFILVGYYRKGGELLVHLRS